MTSVRVLPAQGDTTAVAIVLPGGKADSFAPVEARQLAGLRIAPIAGSIARGGSDRGVAVWTVRYRYRGWNGAQMSPVADVRWTLDEVRERHGDVPVVLIGHSMGGRAAVHAGGDPSVRGVIALAPWLLDSDPFTQLRDRRVLIVHGDLDRITSPRASRRFAARAQEADARVSYVRIRGDTHAMLLRWHTWHRLATSYALDVLGVAPMPRRVQRALDGGRA